MTIFALACGSAQAGTVVYDGRLPLKAGDFEAGAAGVLVNTGHICSVTLIGLRIGVTNRHCLAPLQNKFGEPNDPNHLVFKRGTQLGPAVAVNVFDGQAGDFFPIREAWISPDLEFGQDWAVMILDASAKEPNAIVYPGQRVQTFSLASSSMVPSPALLSHAGYSETYFRANRRGHKQHDVHVIGREGTLLRHDGANSRGASGGPVWLTGSHLLVAINVNQTCETKYAQNEDACTQHTLSNGAVTIEAFAGMVDSLQREGY